MDIRDNIIGKTRTYLRKFGVPEANYSVGIGVGTFLGALLAYHRSSPWPIMVFGVVIAGLGYIKDMKD